MSINLMYNNRQAEKYRLAYSVYLFNYPLTPEDVAFSIYENSV